MEKTNDNALLEAILEHQKPYWHIPTDLGIKEFKRTVRAIGYKKALANRLISRYKKRAWMEFDSVSRGRGTAPTHPKHGRSVNFTTDNTEESTIKVKNGTKDKE